ncbi:MAG: A/G-specific adenine glycosylase [Myxococcales bacterium]|nr:A/G-specific adenine glycosylase [Myxococcales bacterium]
MAADPARVRAPLLAWYDAHRRTMPWREAPSPWRTWVSEIMLQQTRVESVIPYFHRFLARFPDPAALAAAPLDEVLALWAGLGYYSRARSLHRAAQEVVERHGGEIPNDPETFGALTGVGPYTRGAVMSIAFGRAEPLVDGNVIRVLSRLDHIAEDPRRPAVSRRFWARAAELVVGERPGDLNQALMELGALVCRSRSPLCLVCPVAADCDARAAGTQEDLPLKPKRAERPVTTWTAGLARDDAGRLWLARRAGDGLLGGLWELPAVEHPADLATLGLTAGEPRGDVEHGFTHRVWRIAVVAATGTPHAGPPYDAVEAFAEDALPALSGPGIKALRAAGVELAHRRGAGRKPS